MPSERFELSLAGLSSQFLYQLGYDGKKIELPNGNRTHSPLLGVRLTKTTTRYGTQESNLSDPLCRRGAFTTIASAAKKLFGR